MDRFLAVRSINKAHLQLLGTSCMLIASKLREPKPLPAKSLVYYTDNSITIEDLRVSKLYRNLANHLNKTIYKKISLYNYSFADEYYQFLFSLKRSYYLYLNRSRLTRKVALSFMWVFGDRRMISNPFRVPYCSHSLEQSYQCDCFNVITTIYPQESYRRIVVPSAMVLYVSMNLEDLTVAAYQFI